MATILGEIHLWNNFNESRELNLNNFGAIRHYEKKQRNDTLTDEGKRIYCEKRYGITSTSSGTNRRHAKLKELEDTLQQHRIVYSKWQSNNVFQFVFTTGLIATIKINAHTCSIENILFDNYFVGKLDSDLIYDVLILKSHILFILHDNLITLAHLSKPLKKGDVPEKLNRCEVQMHTQDLSSTNLIGKCKMSANINGDLIVIWRMYNGDEVQPWSPSSRDPTHANMHVYAISRTKLELICTYRTDFDPVCVTFSSLNTNVLHSVEQKISSKGVVTVETCSYEVQKSQLSRTIVISIPLQKQVCCHCFNSSNRKLLLGCIDGSIVLFDQGRGTTLVVKTFFIPSMITLNNDGSLILAANEQSQMQFFDVALNTVSIQMIGEESLVTNIVDLSQYFKTRNTLSKLLWCLKPDNNFSTMGDDHTQTDSTILLLYERGQMAALKLASSNGVRSNVCEMGYTPDVMIKEYLSMNQVAKAINVLMSLDWNFWGTICLISLNRIFNHLLRQPFTPETEGQIQMTLSSFHAPIKPHCQEVIEEYENSVKRLSRRFFHVLIRYQLFEKAFCLAIDIGDHDLFMDMNYSAWLTKDYEMAITAKNKALQLLNQ